MAESYHLHRLALGLALLCLAKSQQQTDSSVQKAVFDILYKTSSPFGILPTYYFLSTYSAFYSDAELACQALGGHLADINSPRELKFVKDFIRDDMSEHEFIHINGYRDSNSGPFVSSKGVNLVPIINEEGGGGSGNSSRYSMPLYFEYFPNYPSRVNNPPSCLEFDKRGTNIAMVTSRCDRSVNRYICEKAY